MSDRIRMKPKGRLPRLMKLLAFGSICVVALLPPAVVGYFQQYEFAEETVRQLALHLSTIVHQAREGNVSPQLTVATMQNNKLVVWSEFSRGGTPVARAGLIPGPGDRRARVIEVNPGRAIAPQLPKPDLLAFSRLEYRVRLPLAGPEQAPAAVQDFLETGVSYGPLYSLAQDYFALSGLLFLTAFFFLLGAAIFVDAYISRFTMRVLRAIRSNREWPPAEELGLSDRLYSPTFGALMEALERRDDQLIDTRNTLETVFNGLKVAVAMVSTEKRIVLVNHYFLELLGDKREEDVISQPCAVLNLPGQTPSVEDLVSRTLKSLRYESEQFDVSVLGEPRSFAQEAFPLFAPDGLPAAVIVQCRDVTIERLAQKTMQDFNAELQRQLEEQRRKLEETHQKLLQSARLAAVGELAGGVAHEINNPNGVILAGARYVHNRIQGDQQIPEYVDKYLQRIIKQSERVADIVRALLTFSRRRPQEKSVLHIQEAINDALEIASSRLANARVTLVRDVPAELPFVSGNRNELAQVFLNLFNNATDAMPDGGEIRVSAAPGRERLAKGGEVVPAIRVVVRDTGEGIPAELVDKIMEPFFTTKPVGKGTGLGLSISLGIIEEHGGIMRARNHPEGGAEFEILLPIVGKGLEKGES